MRISQRPNSPQSRSFKAQGRPQATAHAKDRVEITRSSTQETSRRVGKIGKFVAKVPDFLAHTAKFVGLSLLGGLNAAVQIAAGSLGLVGMAGLGLAGALEVRDGLKEKDRIKVLSGCGEITRGAFTGALSAEHLLNLGRHAGTVAAVTAGLGVLQGGIHLSSGAMKFTEGQAKNLKRRRLEGALEMGMGAASLAMLAGPLTPVAIGSYAALATARFGVVNWERIQSGASKAKAVTKDYWENMKATLRS